MNDTFRCRMVRPNNSVWDILMVQDVHYENVAPELIIFLNTGEADHGYEVGAVYRVQITREPLDLAPAG